jgi:hypothetical protein
VANPARTVPAARHRTAPAFALDIGERFYLISPPHENKNSSHPTSAPLRCFDHCPGFQLHGRRSSEARRANDNDNWHRGWCSPVWKRATFSSTWVISIPIKRSRRLFPHRAPRSFLIRGSTKGEPSRFPAKSLCTRVNRRSSSTRPRRPVRSKEANSLSACRPAKDSKLLYTWLKTS